MSCRALLHALMWWGASAGRLQPLTRSAVRLRFAARPKPQVQERLRQDTCKALKPCLGALCAPHLERDSL